MGIAERKIRQKEEVKASILNAAWNLVEEEGWQALSIRKIAEAIEYSVPVIYDHFENKEAILMEFTRRGFQLLNESIAAAKEPFTEPEQQIEALAYAYWKFAFIHPQYYRLMYGMGMPGCDKVKQIAELHTFSQLLREPLQALIEKNGKDADSYLKLRTLWSTLHGLISINGMSSGEKGDDELNEMVLKDFILMFIAGMK
ncbi:MAG: TetR/AcrR family transcriptional regulator [Chitinophagaceae bacterium]